MNAIEWFYELRKLLAAIKGGNNNVYNSINSILIKLNKLGYITKDRKNKILNKYFWLNKYFP